MNAAPTPDPDEDLPEYLRDIPPADENEPPVTSADALEPLATLPLPTHTPKTPKAAVVQMPGTKAKAGGRHGQPKRSPVDLERMAFDYAAGMLSMREIGAKHNRSAAMVIKLAKQNGWQRDLRAQARIKSAAMVNGSVTAVTAPVHAIGTETDLLAANMAFVRTKHRDLIKDARDVLSGLIREVRSLASVGDIGELYDQALGIEDPSERAVVLKQAIDKILALPSRVYGINKLSVAAKNIIALERQAFDLDAPDEGATPPPREKDVSPEEVYTWLAQQKPA